MACSAEGTHTTRPRGRTARATATVAALAAALLLAGCSSSSKAVATAGEPADSLASLKIISTDVTVQSGPDGAAAAGTTGEGLAVGDTVATDDAGFAEVGFFDGSFTRVDHAARFTIVDLQNPQASQVVHTDLAAGRSWNRIEKLSESQTWETDTPVASATVRGTAFVSDCALSTPDACRFQVVAGTVELGLTSGSSVSLTAGQEITIVKDEPPPAPTTVGVATLLEDGWIAHNVQLDTDAGQPSLEQASSPIDGQYRLSAAEDMCNDNVGSVDGETLTIDGGVAGITNPYGPWSATVTGTGPTLTLSFDEQIPGPPATSESGTPLPPPHMDMTITFNGDRVYGSDTVSGVLGSGSIGYDCERSFTGTKTLDGSSFGSTTTTAPTGTTVSSSGAHCDQVDADLAAMSPQQGWQNAGADPQWCTDEWAVGSAQDAAGDESTVVLHWDGAHWQPVGRTGPCADGSIPPSIYPAACQTN